MNGVFFCENYNNCHKLLVLCSPYSEPFSMLSQDFSHIPSLPYHAHVSDRVKRAKATLRVAEASEASEATCI